MGMVQACRVMTASQADFSGDWEAWMITEDGGEDGAVFSFIAVWHMHTLAKKSRNYQVH